MRSTPKKEKKLKNIQFSKKIQIFIFPVYMTKKYAYRRNQHLIRGQLFSITPWASIIPNSMIFDEINTYFLM